MLSKIKRQHCKIGLSIKKDLILKNRISFKRNGVYTTKEY
jgi:hypothetical protein